MNNTHYFLLMLITIIILHIDVYCLVWYYKLIGMRWCETFGYFSDTKRILGGEIMP